MKTFLLSVVITCCTTVSAQDFNRIFDAKPTTAEAIKRGRQLLLESLLDNDLQQADTYYLYLRDTVANADYAAFTPYETLIMSVYLQHYQDALQEIYYTDSIGKIRNQHLVTKKIYPDEDGFAMKLTEKYYAIMPVSFTEIRLADYLQEEEKEVLILVIDGIFMHSDVRQGIANADSVQNNLNNRSNAFLTTYPASKYAGYVHDNILFETKLSDLGFSCEFLLGYFGHTGNYKNYFTDAASFQFGFSGFYKRTALFLEAVLASPKLKKDIDNWYKGSKSSSGTAYAALGFDVANKKSISVYPFVGVGVNMYGPDMEYEEDHPEFDIQETDLFTYIAGVNLDYKIRRTANAGGYMPLRLAIMYGMPTKHAGKITGNFFNISLGVSFIARKTVKK
ncbi:MAG: hypothetical protein LBD53_10845 [Tannerella sp.]|jgi:hypothetical protein|nr:hypothetical protein [Tannerella sp.]